MTLAISKTYGLEKLESARAQIVINTATSGYGDSQEHMIGISIRKRQKILIMQYPVQGSLSAGLVFALEAAVLKCPGLTDIDLKTKHKFLWESAHYTDATLSHLIENGSKMHSTYPPQNDLSNTLSRYASNGILSPTHVDYHIYAASITDSVQSYAAGVIWGDQQAQIFSGVLPFSDTAIAEAHVVNWALGIIPHSSLVMFCTMNEEIASALKATSDLRKEIKSALIPIAKTIKQKQIKIRTETEKYHPDLAKSARQLSANMYSSYNPTYFR